MLPVDNKKDNRDRKHKRAIKKLKKKLTKTKKALKLEKQNHASTKYCLDLKSIVPPLKLEPQQSKEFQSEEKQEPKELSHVCDHYIAKTDSKCGRVAKFQHNGISKCSTHNTDEKPVTEEKQSELENVKRCV